MLQQTQLRRDSPPGRTEGVCNLALVSSCSLMVMLQLDEYPQPAGYASIRLVQAHLDPTESPTLLTQAQPCTDCPISHVQLLSGMGMLQFVLSLGENSC